MSTTTISTSRPSRPTRLRHPAALLLAGIATYVITVSSHWDIAVFGACPDLALLYGGGCDPRKGN